MPALTRHGVAATSAVLFAVVLATTVAGFWDRPDRAVLHGIDQVTSGAGDAIFGAIAFTSGTVVSGLWIAGALLVAWRSPALRPLLLLGVVAVAAGTGVELLLKVLVDHPGPNAARTPAALFGGPSITTRGSFPSGHLIRGTLMAGVTAAAVLRRRAGPRGVVIVAAGVYVLLIAWTRLYLAEHWLSDTAGGGLLGAALLAAVLDATGRRTVPRIP